jgi:kynurenine formamidase
MRRLAHAIALLASPAVMSAQPINVLNYRVVDLTHAFNAQTVYWPTTPPAAFRLEQLARGQTAGGYFYSANALATAEHGGTHLDAPSHFAQAGRTTDQVPLDQLVGRAYVIDISAKAAANPDYLMTSQDVAEFERTHGRILPGSIILLYTGWGRKWPNKRAYLGDDTPGDATRLHFPSFSPEAVRSLVRTRFIAALGADVASIDGGQSRDFAVHRLVAAANIPAFENVANLDQMPSVGATVIALPMKIQGGSGGPLRIIAMIPK